MSIGPSRLLDLPCEIRNQVYQDLFRDVIVYIRCEQPRKCPKRGKPHQGDHWPECNLLSLTSCCKRTRYEAMPLFFANAIFDFRAFHTAGQGSAHDPCQPAWLEQHLYQCLSRMQRLKNVSSAMAYMSPFQDPTDMTFISTFGSFTNSEAKEIILDERLEWRRNEPVFDARRNWKFALTTKEIINMLSIWTTVAVILELQLSFDSLLEGQSVWGPVRSKSCLICFHGQVYLTKIRVKSGQASVLVWPQHDRAKEVSQQYLREIGLTAAHQG